MKPQTTVETITPEIAKKYLLTNADHQRKPTATHQLHLRQQMEKGQWMMTGEPIIFDSNGCLVDGQHRLRALVDANMDFEFVVIRGVAPESFVAMNRGKQRSNGNVLEIHGVPNAINVAACVAGVLNYRRALQSNGGKGGSLNSYIRPSSCDIVHEYDKNSDLYHKAVIIGQRAKKRIKGSIPAIVSALAMIDAKRPVEEVEHFWSLFESGAGLCVGDPILVFKNRMDENNASKSKLSGYLVMMLAVKAWNAYRENKSIKILRVTEGESVIPVI